MKFHTINNLSYVISNKLIFSRNLKNLVSQHCFGILENLDFHDFTLNFCSFPHCTLELQILRNRAHKNREGTRGGKRPIWDGGNINSHVMEDTSFLENDLILILYLRGKKTLFMYSLIVYFI